MRWTRSRSEKKVRNKARTHQGSFFRPVLEPLEDRVMLDAAFSALAGEVDARLAVVQSAMTTIVNTAAALPVLNSQMQSIAADSQKALQTFRGNLSTVLSGLDSTAAPEVLEQQLHDALATLGVLHDVNGNGTRDDVDVTKDAAGKLSITINVGVERTVSSPFTFGLGLPGVPLQVIAGGLEVHAGFVYENLTFGLDAIGSPFLDADTHQGEFQAIVSATLKKGVEISGSLGFLAIRATEGGNTGLHADITMDVQGNSVATMRLANPVLNGSAQVDLDIESSFDTANLGADSQYPKVTANLFMFWGLDGSDPSAPRSSLGQEPIIEFRDVTLNVGTFLSNVLRPVVETVRDFMKPLDPLLHIITTEIPGLSDLSKEIGLGPITLKELAKFAAGSGQLPPDYQLLFDLANAATSLHELLIDLDTSSPSLNFNVGTFSLSGNDIRSQVLNPGGLNAENLTNLIPQAVGTLRSVNEQLAASMPPELQPVFDIIDQRLRSTLNGAGFNFPLLDDPLTGIFKLLLGQDVDFVNYTAQFHFDAFQTELLPLPIPILPDFVKVRLNGQVDADVYFKVGYDTYGLRKFLQTGDAVELAKGLYFDASKPLLSFNGSISAGLAAGFIPVIPVPTPVPGVTVPIQPNISINGELAIQDVIVAFGSSSPEFRLFEEIPQPLFNTQGVITAGFTFVVEAGVPGLPALELYKRVLSEKVLFDLYTGPLSNPSNPFIPGPGQPPPAKKVIVVDLNRQQPLFPTFMAAPGNDGVADTINVVVQNGYMRVFINGREAIKAVKLTNIGSVRIIGSEDDDLLTVDGRLNLPVEFRAGLGVNSLTFDDRGAGGGQFVDYYASSTNIVRETVHTVSGQLLNRMALTYDNVTFLTLYASANTSSTRTTIDHLYNNEFNLIVGSTNNTIIVDTTRGGWADKVTITKLITPLLPPGTTTLIVRDQTAADDFLSGPGHYVLSQDLLTRTKLLPLDFGSLGIVGGSGTTTVDFSGINVDNLTIDGGDRGNDFDIQSTSDRTRYHIAGGLGVDTFVVGQLHDDLPGGTGLERQLGFAAVDITIDGGGGLGDKLTLDDTGSDFLEYTVRNSFDIFADQVWLQSDQELPEDQIKTVNGVFRYAGIEDLTLKTGGLNTIHVHDTLTAPSGFFDVGHTSIVSGSHSDDIYVYATTGALTLDTGGGANFVTIGAAGSLDSIQGEIRLTGQTVGAINHVLISDSLSNLANSYEMTDTEFARTGAIPTENIFFDGMAITTLNVRGGNGGNLFTIDGTPLDPINGTIVDVYTGDMDDFVTVEATSGPLSLNLGNGVYQTVSFGDDTTSLDAIQGDVTVSGGGFIDAFISNELDQTFRYVAIDTDPTYGQTLERYNVVGDQIETLNRFRFPTFGELRLQYTGGQGGDIVFISAVAFSASVAAFGAPGVRDTVGIGFGDDLDDIFGPVYVAGQAADGDFAYYYDQFTANPQSYEFSQHPLAPQALVAERPGIAPVIFDNLAGVIFYAPMIGGNFIDVTSLPVETTLGMFVGADVVTLGKFVDDPDGGDVDVPSERTMADIQGAINVVAYSTDDEVSLLLDDSGNTDTTPRNIEITPATGALAPGTTLTGLPPASIYWNLGATSSVAIRGGAADETFALAIEPSVAALAIDGGGGANTLDYLSLWDQGILPIEDPGLEDPALDPTTGQVSWWRAEGNANDSIDGNHGALVGGVAFAEGRVGQAFQFDGVDDHVLVANAANLEPASISVEAWVKMADGSSEGYILAKGATEDFVSSYYFYVGDGLTFNIFSEGVFSPDLGATIRSFAGSPGDGSIFDGEWHHVVGTYDGAMVRLYVDGTEVGEGTAASFDIGYDLTGSSDLFIGSFNGAFGFGGLIDEVSIFDRALSAAEVQARFTGANGESPPAGPGVYVNLQTGEATGLDGGIANIHNAIGSLGDDILVGNGGNILDGKGGWDLLIAGGSASQPFGGAGEDLLVAGTTDYDLDLMALAMIQAEWTRTDIDYDTRVANLTTDNGVAVPKLIAGDTVFSNGGGNTITGGVADVDLFFASFDLDVTDAEEDEMLVPI